MASGKGKGFIVLFGELFKDVPKIVATIDKGIEIEIRETQEDHDVVEPEDESKDEVILNIVKDVKSVFSIDKPVRIITALREIPKVPSETYYFAYTLALADAFSEYTSSQIPTSKLKRVISKYVEATSLGELMGGGIYLESKDGVDKIIPKSTLYLIISSTHDSKSCEGMFNGVDERIIDEFKKTLSIVVKRAKSFIESGEFDMLGKYMVVNHGMLISFGVSSKVSEAAFQTLMDNGALGAKISGKEGEFVIGIVDEEEKAVALVKKMREEGFDTFYTKV